MSSTFRIITIVLSVVIILTSIPNIIYYNKVTSGSDTDINRSFAQFMLWLNVVLIIVGVGIAGYSIFSSFTSPPKEKDIVVTPRYKQQYEPPKQQYEPPKQKDKGLSEEFSVPQYEEDIERVTDNAVIFG